MTSRTRRIDTQQQRIGVTIDANSIMRITLPEVAPFATIRRDCDSKNSFAHDALLERFRVHPGDHQHLLGGRILYDGGDHSRSRPSAERLNVGTFGSPRRTGTPRRCRSSFRSLERQFVIVKQGRGRPRPRRPPSSVSSNDPLCPRRPTRSPGSNRSATARVKSS